MGNIRLLPSRLVKNTKKIKNLDDIGVADRVAEKYQDKLYYLDKKNEYVLWTGKVWKSISLKNLDKIIFEVINNMDKELEKSSGFGVLEDNTPVTSDDLIKYKKSISTASGIKKIREILPICEKIVIEDDRFDKVKNKINLQNGILDLRTGELDDHRPDFYSTRIASVNYEKNANCDNFKKFIKQICNNRPSLVEYMQTIIGYLFTGETREQKIFIFHGVGANGKSTLLNILKKMAGDYGITTAASTLLKTSSSSIPCDIPRLKGKWLAVSSETNMDADLDEAKIKTMTGKEKMVGREIRKNFMDFDPEFKLILATNILPNIKGQDHGIKRRMVVIPFDHKIKEKDIDKDLEEKLSEEFPGIFSWIVEGAKRYYKTGLPNCSVVEQATRNYIEDNDVIAKFLDDECDTTSDKNTIPLLELWNLFNIWAEKNVYDKIKKKIFSELIKRKGFEQVKSGSVRKWKGITIKSKFSVKK